jgi:putative iron-regulated protein
MRNVYTGSYTRIDGSILRGPSISDLVTAKDPSLDASVREHLDATIARMQALVDSAEQDGIAYDQLIAAGNPAGNAKVMAAINALLVQTRNWSRSVLRAQTVSTSHPASINAWPAKRHAACA